MEIILIAAAILLRVAAGTGYLVATVKGVVRPSIVSWFFWGLTALIAFTVQLYEHAGLGALSTLALGASPVAVFVVAFYKQKGALRFTTTDKITAAVTALGIALWLLTKNPLMAMLFSIAADFVSGIPTIIKSIKDPSSERALPYFLSIMSMVCTLAAIRDWTVAAYAFPLYILFTNMVFFGLIASRIGPRTQRWLRRRRVLTTASMAE